MQAVCVQLYSDKCPIAINEWLGANPSAVIKFVEIAANNCFIFYE